MATKYIYKIIDTTLQNGELDYSQTLWGQSVDGRIKKTATDWSIKVAASTYTADRYNALYVGAKPATCPGTTICISRDPANGRTFKGWLNPDGTPYIDPTTGKQATSTQVCVDCSIKLGQEWCDENGCSIILPDEFTILTAADFCTCGEIQYAFVGWKKDGNPIPISEIWDDDYHKIKVLVSDALRDIYRPDYGSGATCDDCTYIKCMTLTADAKYGDCDFVCWMLDDYTCENPTPGSILTKEFCPKERYANFKKCYGLCGCIDPTPDTEFIVPGAQCSTGKTFKWWTYRRTKYDPGYIDPITHGIIVRSDERNLYKAVFTDGTTCYPDDPYMWKEARTIFGKCFMKWMVYPTIDADGNPSGTPIDFTGNTATTIKILKADNVKYVEFYCNDTIGDCTCTDPTPHTCVGKCDEDRYNDYCAPEVCNTKFLYWTKRGLLYSRQRCIKVLIEDYDKGIYKRQFALDLNFEDCDAHCSTLEVYKSSLPAGKCFDYWTRLGQRFNGDTANPLVIDSDCESESSLYIPEKKDCDDGVIDEITPDPNEVFTLTLTRDWLIDYVQDEAFYVIGKNDAGNIVTFAANGATVNLAAIQIDTTSIFKKFVFVGDEGQSELVDADDMNACKLICRSDCTIGVESQKGTVVVKIICENQIAGGKDFIDLYKVAPAATPQREIYISCRYGDYVTFYAKPTKENYNVYEAKFDTNTTPGDTAEIGKPRYETKGSHKIKKQTLTGIDGDIEINETQDDDGFYGATIICFKVMSGERPVIIVSSKVTEQYLFCFPGNGIPGYYEFDPRVEFPDAKRCSILIVGAGGGGASNNNYGGNGASVNEILLSEEEYEKVTLFKVAVGRGGKSGEGKHGYNQKSGDDGELSYVEIETENGNMLFPCHGAAAGHAANLKLIIALAIVGGVIAIVGTIVVTLAPALIVITPEILADSVLLLATIAANTAATAATTAGIMTAAGGLLLTESMVVAQKWIDDKKGNAALPADMLAQGIASAHSYQGYDGCDNSSRNGGAGGSCGMSGALVHSQWRKKTFNFSKAGTQFKYKGVIPYDDDGSIGHKPWIGKISNGQMIPGHAWRSDVHWGRHRYTNAGGDKYGSPNVGKDDEMNTIFRNKDIPYKSGGDANNDGSGGKAPHYGGGGNSGNAYGTKGGDAIIIFRFY
ncbi:hypothetical protein FACS1894195_0020 [Bacteroidia bacterium]|nr:hypothetical protein FACS1894195_0020 [Bacteroidia bacterium]